MAMLLALTRPSRSADLQSLDIQRFKHLLEFFPSKLPKQTKAGKMPSTFFFPSFPENDRLCPVKAVEVYIQRTEDLRQGRALGECPTQLFIAFIKPHNPVSSATIARWLRTVLQSAGININIFKAHSTRGASASAAAGKGVTTNDILQAADWSSELVFRRFYYRPVHNTSFGRSVLSK